MPDFLYPDMPGSAFDHGEDAVCPKSVPLPFADLIDFYHHEFAVGTATDHAEGIPPGEGSVGSCLPAPMMPGMESTFNIEGAFEHTPLAKPTSSATRDMQTSTVSVSIMEHYEAESVSLPAAIALTKWGLCDAASVSVKKPKSMRG